MKSDGSPLRPSWRSPSGRAAFWFILSLVLLLLLLPPSRATGQAITGTSSPAAPSLESLLPTLDKAIDSSMSTDARLTYFEEALKQERTQRQSDNADRQKEISNWQGISETLSAQVTTQQSYLSDFDSRLGTFSGSEQERHDAAVKALDNIEADAKALERSRDLWRIAGIGGGVVAVVAIIVAVAK